MVSRVVSQGTSQVAKWLIFHLPMQEKHETRVLTLVQVDSLEEEMATCSSFLAWTFPWTVESVDSHTVGHDWSNLAAAAYQQSCDPMNCSPPGSSIHVDSPGNNTGMDCMPSSRASSQPTVWIQVSCIAARFFTIWITREVQGQ